MYSAPTEKLQSWHQPKKIKISPKKCQDVFGQKKAPEPISGVDFSALFSGNMNCQYVSVLRQFDSKLPEYTVPLPACVTTKNPPFSLDISDPSEILFIQDKLIFDLADMWDLERMTMEQSQSVIWKTERKWRITASKFYDVCVRRSDFEKLASSLISSHSQDISHLPAVAYGVKNEGLVRNHVRSIFPNHIIRKVGLVTNPYMPHLAASPDGLIYSKSDAFILEVKCSFNPKQLYLSDLSSTSNFCLTKENNSWQLKKNHRYYYQIQGQLALTNLSTCVFALLYRRPNFVYTEIVNFDPEFWSDMKVKLDMFYEKYYITQLIKSY